jgi:hypothetical protein
MTRGIVGRRGRTPAGAVALQASAVAVLIAVAVAAARSGVQAGAQASTPSGANAACAAAGLEPLVPPAPPSTTLPALNYDPMRGFDPEVLLGIGHLSAVDRFDADWPSGLTMPLFREAAGTVSAWLVEGWVMPIGATPRPLGVAGLVETGYEVPSFTVHDSRPDGWVRLRVERGAAGLVWTHACFFEQAPTTMRIERWEARFGSDETSPLYFRAAERHALRGGPSVSSELLRWIPADSRSYVLHPLETRGDWMRVELSVPSDYCTEPDDPPSDKAIGWVRWRDDDRGPWVWYFTRGC